MADPATPDDLAALMTLLDDVRCDLVEAQKAFTGQGKDGPMQTVLTQLDAIFSVVTHPPESPAVPLLQEVLQVLAPKPPARPWWHRWHWPAAVGLAALLGLGVGAWTMRPSAAMRTWATLGQRLDGVVLEQYLALGKSAQDALTKLYRELGMVPPGDRKGKKA